MKNETKLCRKRQNSRRHSEESRDKKVGTTKNLRKLALLRINSTTASA